MKWAIVLGASSGLGLACAKQLAEEGVQTLAQLEALTQRAGHAWRPDYSAFDAMSREGELCAAYA